VRRLFGPFFLLAGVLHLVKPGWYVRIVPPYLPFRPRDVVYASGVAEIAGGLGVMHPRTRRVASWWSIATLLGVFPANVHMAMAAERFERGVPGGRRGLYARLPVQALLVAWARAAGRD
jgi:uncharacterized membrane protein